MGVHWHASPSPNLAAEACAQHVLAVLEEVLSASEFATFAVSGGSTPRLLFEKLAASRFRWDRVHLFWVDERSVAPTDPASNYKLADDCLIHPAHMPPRQIHRIHGEIAPRAAAARYAAEIREFFGLADGEMPQFDLVQRGMGADGHTASLFPGEPLIEDREGIAGAVFAAQFNQWRVTLLPGALLAARHTAVLVSGADKAPAVRAVFHEEYEPLLYPAQLGARGGRDIEWFLDNAAAALLE